RRCGVPRRDRRSRSRPRGARAVHPAGAAAGAATEGGSPWRRGSQAQGPDLLPSFHDEPEALVETRRTRRVAGVHLEPDAADAAACELRKALLDQRRSEAPRALALTDDDVLEPAARPPERAAHDDA